MSKKNFSTYNKKVYFVLFFLLLFFIDWLYNSYVNWMDIFNPEIVILEENFNNYINIKRIKTLHIIAIDFKNENECSIIFFSKTRDILYVCNLSSNNSLYEMHNHYNLKKIISIFDYFLEKMEKNIDINELAKRWKFKKSLKIFIIQTHNNTVNFSIDCKHTYNTDQFFLNNK